MVLRGICFWFWSSNQVLSSFSMSDIGPYRIFVSLVAFSEADTLTASTTLLLFFKIVATVEWDMPDWWAITINDFLPSVLYHFWFHFQVNHLTWPLAGNISSVLCILRSHNEQNNTRSNQIKHRQKGCNQEMQWT